MSIADALIAEGVEQGIEQGEKQGLLRTAKNCLREGMELALVVKLTGLEISDIENFASDTTR